MYGLIIIKDKLSYLYKKKIKKNTKVLSTKIKCYYPSYLTSLISNIPMINFLEVIVFILLPELLKAITVYLYISLYVIILAL